MTLAWKAISGFRRNERNLHEYYALNKDKFKKGMHKHLSLAAPELEKAGGKKYAELSEKIWDYYEKSLLERFPYIGGDK